MKAVATTSIWGEVDSPLEIMVRAKMESSTTRTRTLRLEGRVGMVVREAKSGDEIHRGLALLAPADFQMRVVRVDLVAAFGLPHLHLAQAVEPVGVHLGKAHGHVLDDEHAGDVGGQALHHLQGGLRSAGGSAQGDDHIVQDGAVAQEGRRARHTGRRVFLSVAEQAKCKTVGIIMTGMGRDGADGLLQMRKAGAYTIGL